jgi:putative membrane protein
LRNLLDHIFLYIKGLCIGATGVLHGVSGGSMALLLGVHLELVKSLGSFNRHAYRLLRQKKFAAFWKGINGNFLLAVLTGIFTGLLTLRSIFYYYFDQYPIFISSFFFSLVIIAALLLLRKVRQWNPGVVLALITGLIFSYLITRSGPALHTRPSFFRFRRRFDGRFYFVDPRFVRCIYLDVYWEISVYPY